MSSFGIRLGGPKPPTKKPVKGVFGNDDDDDEKIENDNTHGKPKSLLSSYATSAISNKAAKLHAEALEVDSSIFDYDGVYDSIKALEKRKESEKRHEAEERKPRYMNTILEAAERRKADRLRSHEKMIQREREAEGDQYAETESFVTDAYRAMQEEIRQQDEQDRKRSEKEDVTKTGMTSFYKNLLEREEKEHIETLLVAETDQTQLNFNVNREIIPEKSDTQIALEAKEMGLQVELNEDNKIFDKRQLLKAGLNIQKKPSSVQQTKMRGGSFLKSDSAKEVKDTGTHQSNKRSRASRENESSYLQEQYLQLQNEEEEKKQKEHEELIGKLVKRNDEGTISNAKERYLARKKAKIESS